MTIRFTAFIVCLASVATPFGYAASGRAHDGTCEYLYAKSTDAMLCEATNPEVGGSLFSSSVLPDAPDAAAIETARGSHNPLGFGRNTKLRLATAPFSQLAIGLTFGSGGLGFQAATPLATKLNLRIGGSFLNYNPIITEQGIPIDGAVRLRSAYAGVDVYPYRGTFHITPGVTMYNGNRMTATTNIAGGQHFSINDTDYVSDPTDPVYGYFDVSLGKRFAPSLTLGFGNMLKRSSNWTLQTDFGVQFIGTPRFTLVMNGSVCTPQDGCTRIQDDPETVANLAQQQTDVNREIQPLRFYPILTTALSYRFGHKTSTTYWR